MCISGDTGPKTLIFASQNTSIKSEVPTDQQEYALKSEKVTMAINIISEAYPEYVSVKEGPLAKLIANDKENVVLEALNDLAQL